jgi:pyruvate formate lyase activating enzyme
VIFAEYAMDTADACHALGVKTVAVTAGYIHLQPAQASSITKMDAANVDLKAFTDDFYFKLCGAHLQPVLDILRYDPPRDRLLAGDHHPADPGKNDSDDELKAMLPGSPRNSAPTCPLHFSAFHPDYKMGDIPARRRRHAGRARRIALDAGLRYVYTGNVHDKAGDATHCPGCGEAVIQRDWYRILGYGSTTADIAANAVPPSRGATRNSASPLAHSGSR